MLVVAFIPVFILALFFFVLILELVDLFANLWRYLNFEVPLSEMLRVMVLYLPKCISFSIPIALLFSISFTLGNLYANNELISVFSAGVSLYKLVVPLILISLFLSGFWFFFEEYTVIDTFEKKNDLQNILLKQKTTLSNTNVTVLSSDNRIVYFAEYYNDSTKTLSKVTIIVFDKNHVFSERLEAETATWEKGKWIFKNARHFFWDSSGEFITEEFASTYSNEMIDQPPSTFRKTVRNIEEMKREKAKEWIRSLRVAGLPFRGALTEYYKRYSFAFTPFIVALISCAVGGRLKKNILLMSLLLSLGISVIYYVMQMVLILFAKLGYIPPLAGAWGTFLIFMFVSFYLFKVART